MKSRFSMLNVHARMVAVVWTLALLAAAVIVIVMVTT